VQVITFEDRCARGVDRCIRRRRNAAVDPNRKADQLVPATGADPELVRGAVTVGDRLVLLLDGATLLAA